MSFRLRIISDAAGASDDGHTGMPTLANTATLLVQAEGACHAWTDSQGARCFLLGDALGPRRADGSLADTSVGRLELQQLRLPEGLDRYEGRYVVVRVAADGGGEVWTDRFGQVDLYYQADGRRLVMATDLGLLPMARGGATPEPVAFAHVLTVYGCRPAKRETLYCGVRRLGVDEGARVREGKIELTERPFRPAAVAPYGERELNDYADTLIEAVRARGSASGNVVYLSSGWDSTALLGCLVHVFGARKVRAVIGRMRYSERSGVINQFELDRAQAVADFYGVRLDTVELDYRRDAAAVVERALPLFRSQQFASVTGLNHLLLAEGAARTSPGDEVVFAGEMSDGAHNLGFSQFVTIFHPVMEFREYSDKMASYLFGPTFLSLLQQDRHGADPIWGLFRSRAGDTVFDEPATGPEARTRQMLASFFLRGGRLPLYSLRNTLVLSAAGADAYRSAMEPAYLDRAGREATPETLYAWYLHLYNSFHWQGSTVATLPATAEQAGLRCALPFHDGRLQDFLSAMPESWGRGLDLHPTKYPLKWMLKHRIRYPMHLQVGPHSYLYDVDPSFSHSAELLFGSSLGELFKSRLRGGAHERWLAAEWFDLAYIRGIVGRYLSGEEFRGSEMNDVMALGLLAMTGCYGD